jgi:hypothetical protein
MCDSGMLGWGMNIDMRKAKIELILNDYFMYSSPPLYDFIIDLFVSS